MEEDIKILEEMFYDDESFEPNGYIEIFLHKNEQQAIKNLIARYKEVEQENQSYKDYYGTPPCYDNAKYISKSKVKEKIEELNNEFNERNSKEEDFNYNYGEEYAFAEEKLKELLED